MKYETPELTTLAPAIGAIESATGSLPKIKGGTQDGPQAVLNEFTSAYEDWE